MQDAVKLAVLRIAYLLITVKVIMILFVFWCFFSDQNGERQEQVGVFFYKVPRRFIFTEFCDRRSSRLHFVPVTMHVIWVVRSVLGDVCVCKNIKEPFMNICTEQILYLRPPCCGPYTFIFYYSL